MTEERAIEVLEERYLTMSMCGDIEQCKRNNQAISSAITALKEIQQYRAIGTVEECREAKEKQRGKKPIKGRIFKSLGYYQCPICGGLLMRNEKFCSECGQAIDWSE